MSAFRGKKIVHIDLKGAPPKIEYLLRFIRLLREWGASGILVEYEDMFPYKGEELQDISKPHCYTLNDIEKLQSATDKDELIFIPLVQTFGHMEFVLKHARFRCMLETDNNPISVCPLHTSSLALVKSLVDQVVEAHDDLNYLHIGGDEVFNLGTCKNCQTSNLSKQELYSNHMVPLLQYIKGKWPNISLLMWHDMLAEYTIEELQPFANLVEPMVWGYVDDISTYFPKNMFQQFGEVFDGIWIASSFKGSSGPAADYVPIEHHVSNHYSWLQLISHLPEATQCKISGIALTGWSRYDHFATLCELLPSAIPSLVLCLAVLENGCLTADIQQNIAQQLGFSSTSSLKPLFNGSLCEFEKGCFPSAEVFLYVTYFEKAKFFLKKTNFELKGWLDPWRRKHGHLNAAHVAHAHWCCETALRDLSFIRAHVGKYLEEIYDDETVQEWLHVKIDAKIKKGNGYLEILNSF